MFYRNFPSAKGESKWWKNYNLEDFSSPILWPPDAKSQLIGKDSDAGKD